MPLGHRISRAGDESLGSKVKAQVVPRDGKPAHHRLHQPTPDRAWRLHVVARESMGCDGRIAGEQLIASIAPQRHLHIPASEGREEVGGDDRCIAQRLVQQRRQPGDQVQQHRRLEHQLAVVCPEVPRHLARIARFVKGALRETDREALHVAPEPRHHGRHRARVDSPREEHPHRHVADQLLAHRLEQNRTQLLAAVVQAGAVGVVRLAQLWGPVAPQPQ